MFLKLVRMKRIKHILRYYNQQATSTPTQYTWHTTLQMSDCKQQLNFFCEFLFFLPGDEVCVNVRVDNLSGSSARVKVFAMRRDIFRADGSTNSKSSVVSNTASCESTFHQLAFN